jgi:Cd2+/Zn2+-exporting ATPase
MDLRPDSATVVTNGEEKIIPAEEVAVGNVLIIRPGERVPVDCIVTEGSSTWIVRLTGETFLNL